MKTVQCIGLSIFVQRQAINLLASMKRVRAMSARQCRIYTHGALAINQYGIQVMRFIRPDERLFNNE